MTIVVWFCVYSHNKNVQLIMVSSYSTVYKTMSLKRPRVKNRGRNIVVIFTDKSAGGKIISLFISNKRTHC